MTTTQDLPRKLLDVACRVRVAETLHRDDELVDQAAFALMAALDEIAQLRSALRFYARHEHYCLDDDEEFDTVSDEPQNWLCSGLDGSATMIENGGVARCALLGEPITWLDGDDDTTPQPIDGEQSCAALAGPEAPAAAPGPVIVHAYWPDGRREEREFRHWPLRHQLPEDAVRFDIAWPDPLIHRAI